MLLRFDDLKWHSHEKWPPDVHKWGHSISFPGSKSKGKHFTPITLYSQAKHPRQKLSHLARGGWCYLFMKVWRRSRRPWDCWSCHDRGSCRRRRLPIPGFSYIHTWDWHWPEGLRAAPDSHEWCGRVGVRPEHPFAFCHLLQCRCWHLEMPAHCFHFIDCCCRDLRQTPRWQGSPREWFLNNLKADADASRASCIEGKSKPDQK